MRLYDHARNFIGLKEIPGSRKNNPWIQWALSLCQYDPNTPDEVPWCSAAMNGWCYGVGVKRTGSARARSWLREGAAVDLADARRGDVVILARDGATLDATVTNAPGHVGLLDALGQETVTLLAGNQGNQVSLASWPLGLVIGVRRLAE